MELDFKMIPAELVLSIVPTCWNSSGLGLELELNHCNKFQHTKTQTVSFGPIPHPHRQHLNRNTLARIKYLSSDCIVTWSRYRMSSLRCTCIAPARFTIRQIFVESVAKTHEFCWIWTLISQPLNIYQSDHKSECRRCKCLETSKSAYLLCHDTIRTHIFHSRESCRNCNVKTVVEFHASHKPTVLCPVQVTTWC
jgi:hypothetical protein